MTGHPLIANPLGWAHLRIYGGPRRLFTFLGGYSGVVLILLVLIFRLLRDQVTFSRYCSSAMFVLLAVQGVFLFFFGTTAIKRAILQDFTSDMITSHRLTGMGGHTAVIGYLTGPTSQVLALSVINYLFCTVLAALSGYGFRQALMVNAAMLALALLLAVLFWTLSVLVGLSTRGKIALTGVLAAFVFLHQVPVFDLLPGLQLLLTRTAITNILNAGDLSDVGWLLLIGMAGQFVLASLFFLASARKFGRDDVLAFTPTLALSLLAACALLGAVGLAYNPPTFASRFFESFHEPRKQLIATVTALTLIALLPVINAAKTSAAWARRKKKDAAYSVPRPRSYWETALIAAFLLLAILTLVCTNAAKHGRFEENYSPPLSPSMMKVMRSTGATPVMIQLPFGQAPVVTAPPVNVETSALLKQTAFTSAGVILALLTVGGLLRFFYSVVEKAMWVLVLYIVICWAIPPFLDLTLEAVSGTDSWSHRTVLFTASPIGLSIAAWMKFDAPLKAGVVVQALLAGLAYLLSRRAKT